jgi:hypothetical protein
LPIFAAATIVSKRHLPLARVIAESCRAHNPALPFFVLLTDEAQGYFDPQKEPFQTVELTAIPIEDAVPFRFQYDEMELSYAATPSFLLHLLNRGFDGVLFLKQETLVLDSLAPLFARLADHSVVLTPHFLHPPAIPTALEQELNVLRAGVFNGGVIAFSNSEEARRILAWWQRKVQRNCFRAVEEGIHFEQRWLDFVPSLAPHAHILRDPGINVGHWNILDRQIAASNGRFTAAGAPCRIVRFSGYDYENPRLVTRYNSQLTVASTGPAAPIFREYQDRLTAAGYPEAQRWPYAYGSFDNGVPIPSAARRAYHDLDTQAQRFPNPFATAGDDSFYHWFKRTKQ